MILLVPILDFVASEISVVHRLLKCSGTQIQSCRAVSVTPTTSNSIPHPKPRLPPFPFVPPLTLAFPTPHVAVFLSAA